MRKLQKAVFWFTLISFASANTPQKHLTPGVSLDGETLRFGSGVSRCVRNSKQGSVKDTSLSDLQICVAGFTA